MADPIAMLGLTLLPIDQTGAKCARLERVGAVVDEKRTTRKAGDRLADQKRDGDDGSLDSGKAGDGA